MQTLPPATTEAQTRFREALALHQRGQLAQAQVLYEQVLGLQPDHPDALHLLGVIASKSQQHARATELIDRAIAIRPGDPVFHFNRANALRALRRLDEALASFDQAVRLKPDFAEAFLNRGNALRALRRPEDALASYDQAVRLKPDYANGYSNRGVTLHDLRRLDEALASFDRAIQLKPDNPEAFNNRGLALQDMKRPEEALASYDRAIALKSDYANAYSNRGLMLQELDRMEEAVASYDRAVQLSPDDGFLYGSWLYARMKLCDWNLLDTAVADLLDKIGRRLPVTPPFAMLALTSSAAAQRQAAEIIVSEKFPFNPALPALTPRARPKRLRIGYYSADYHNHPTAYLMAELFERHDRERFELIAFSSGPDRDDEMRRRVAAAFDRFVDVRDRSDREIALLSREMEIDIAVNLKGFTLGHRLGVFAHRAAPVQVSYLGYPGTMGAPYIDYLIADRILIPEESRRHYSEKIVCLPDSYQVNDRRRAISDRKFTRQELGLPKFAFVFCSFNHNFKYSPATFDGWMRILKRLGNSVLWLSEDNETAANNLRREAEARGVGAERLVFAKQLPLAEHLARHRAADLYLDTLPCNAHTSASDALWAGLPVLTCTGEAFASRVAASLLHAIGLPELVASDQQQYETLAVELATHPEGLAAIREKLGRNRQTAPLFDTRRFTRHLESAYVQMYERHQSGQPPEHLVIEASSS